MMTLYKSFKKMRTVLTREATSKTQSGIQLTLLPECVERALSKAVSLELMLKSHSTNVLRHDKRKKSYPAALVNIKS